MANGPQTQTALEADGESAAYPESEGLPKNSKESGMELAPMGNLCALVNENLRDCPEKSCKGTQLKLEVDRRIGFASSWKLTCSSCENLETAANNRLNYLKRKRENTVDWKEKRTVGQVISRLNIKNENKRQLNKQQIHSPLVNKKRTRKHKQRKVMDYAVNVRAVLASFYIGTGGMDIGLANLCQGMAGGKSWE